MSIATVRQRRNHQCFRLSNVDWKTYSRLLSIFAERPGIRLTYDRGELEIMAPLLVHDSDSRFLSYLVLAMTDELKLPIVPGGATTLRTHLKRKGIEADECFWIANAHRLPSNKRLDLRRDPPPDLAIEVDVTHSSLDRLAIYAALEVPEVWELKGKILTFHVLGSDGQYVNSDTSRAFFFLNSAELLPFIQRASKAHNVNPILRDFRAWVRRRIAKGR